jgi:uncharacterized protein YndB with AHSA1/START domain
LRVRGRQSIERTIDLPAGPERVWEALTEADQLSGWFGARVDLEPTAGSRVRFRWPDGRERLAVVESAERPRFLALRWLPFERLPDGRTRPVGPGGIEFTVRGTDQATSLTVVEWGPELLEVPGQHFLMTPPPAPGGPVIRARIGAGR